MSLGANPRAVLTALFARAAAQIGVGILVGVLLCKPLMAALGNTEPVRMGFFGNQDISDDVMAALDEE